MHLSYPYTHLGRCEKQLMGNKVRLAEWSKAAGSSPVTLNMGSGVRIPHLTKKSF